MFARLLAVILWFGACGCVLLGLRQERLQAAHELAETRLRIRQHDEELAELRATIASRVTPREIRRLTEELGPMAPIVVEPIDPQWLQGEAPEGSLVLDRPESAR